MSIDLDETGVMHIWDTKNEKKKNAHEHTPAFSAIKDLAWTPEYSILLGTEKQPFGSIVDMKSGEPVGAIKTLTSKVNSVDVRPIPPLAVVIADDSGTVTFFSGPSLESKLTIREHQNFVHCVRYAPDGSLFVSAGTDKKLVACNGETGKVVKIIADPAHQGGIYGISFHSSSQAFVTASGDKSVKLWRRKSGSGDDDSYSFDCAGHFTFPNVKTNMLLGCLWMGDTIVALTLDAKLHFFSAPATADKLESPCSFLQGHADIITCVAYSPCHKRLLTGDMKGACLAWNLTTCLVEAEMKSNLKDHPIHSFKLQGMAVDEKEGQFMLSIGMDDRCLLTKLTEHEMECQYSIKMPSQPQSIVLLSDRKHVIVVCYQHLVLVKIADDLKSLSLVHQLSEEFGASHLAYSHLIDVAVCVANEKLQAIVVTPDKKGFAKLQVEGISDGVLDKAVFSPTDPNLTVATKRGVTYLYKVVLSNDSSTPAKLILTRLSFFQPHSSRIMSMVWSPDGRQLASAAVSEAIEVRTLDKSEIKLKSAHPRSNSEGLAWISNDMLASAAHDGSIRTWKVAL